MSGFRPLVGDSGQHHAAQTGVCVDQAAFGCSHTKMKLARADLEQQNVARKRSTARRGEPATGRMSRERCRTCLAYGVAVGQADRSSRGRDRGRYHSDAVKPRFRSATMQTKPATDQSLGRAGKGIGRAHAGTG